MDAVALDDGPLHPPRTRADGAHARIHVHTDLPAFAVGVAKAAPAADVVILDHDIVCSGHQPDRVLLRAFERKAAHDDVRRGDGDVVLLAVSTVDGRAISDVEHVAGCGAAFRDVQRVARSHFDRASDWKAFAPGAGAEARAAELDFVFRAGLELHQAAAAFGIA